MNDNLTELKTLRERGMTDIEALRRAKLLIAQAKLARIIAKMPSVRESLPPSSTETEANCSIDSPADSGRNRRIE